MALIHLRRDHSPVCRDTEGNAMRHKNSVFHDLTKLIPWAGFEQKVKEHKADFRVRELPTKVQFLSLLYGQLAGLTGLREIVAALQSHELQLYHVGSKPVARSTLSDANQLRPSELFRDVFALLLGQAHRGLRRAMAGTTYLIDSTSLRLNAFSQWARFSAGVYGAKAHIVYDPDADQPIYFAVTTARVNDITAAKQMPLVPGATYVFDLGYYDFAWWAELDRLACRFVTRLKKNTPFEAIEDLPVAAGQDILSDRIGFLPARQANSRRNPMDHAVREVTVRTETGKVLRIVSNDLDASAEEIAALYKRRWAIELLFRWLKQMLRITKFFGRSENAIRIQIAVALIAFLLLRLAQQTQQLIQSPLTFARLIRINLMQRRRLDRLLDPNEPQVTNTNQLALHGL